MLEIIKIIALLCQIGGSSTIDRVQDAQKACQQDYIKCIRKNKPYTAMQKSDALEKCILENK